MNDYLLIPEDMPILDKARIQHDFGDDSEILAELKDMFLAHAPDMMEEIEMAISNQDFDWLYSSSSSLMGSCSTYGAPRLALVCASLKEAAENNDQETIDVLHGQFVEEFEEAFKAVGELGSDHEQSAGS